MYNKIKANIFYLNCCQIKNRIYWVIEIEFFCLYGNIEKSIESCSIEKSFLPSFFEIRREGFFWIQQRNWKDGKNLPQNKLRPVSNMKNIT